MNVVKIKNSISVVHSELTKPEISPRARITSSDFQATRHLICDWNDHINLAIELLGWTKWENNEIYWFMPHRYPYIVDEMNVASAPIYATAVDPLPFGKPSNSFISKPTGPAISYPKAKLSVTYRSLGTVDNDIDLLVEENIESAVEYLTVPYRRLYWYDGKDVKNDEAPGMLLRTMVWTYRIKNLPHLPAEVHTLRGYVNQYPIISSKYGYTFQPEELLYTPPETRSSFSYLGQQMWDVTYKFLWRPYSWNLLWKGAATGTDDHSGILYPQPMYSDKNHANQVGLYPSGDFSNLFLTIT